MQEGARRVSVTVLRRVNDRGSTERVDHDGHRDLRSRAAKAARGPLRLVVPWKYGYKSIKSIVKIEFTRRKPDTFWNTLASREYDFVSNVDPAVPHPRWSQATEQMIGTENRVQAWKYNGYRKQVGHLHS